MVSQNVPAEVLVFHSFCKHRLDVSGVNALVLWFQIGSFKTDFFEQLLHDGLQSAGADVFRVFIYLEGKFAIESMASSVKSMITSSVAIIA